MRKDRLCGRRISTRKTSILLIILSAFCLTLILKDGPYISLFNSGGTPAAIFSHPMANWSEGDDDLSSCKIPRYHPLDKGIWSYLKAPPKSIKCKNRQPQLSTFDLEQSLLTISRDAKYYSCRYQRVERVNDNDVQFSNACPVNVGPQKIMPVENVQAIRVTCSNFFGFPVYSYIHLVEPKPVMTLQSVSRSRRKPNILIFAVDSVSRLAALRLLPLTVNYLTQKLNAVVLRSHHKVGENTFPNIVSLLTGSRESDLPAIRKPQFFGDWPLIWKNFKREGYETLYGEDFPPYATFNYLAKGFGNPPTDHYLRPFWIAVEETMLVHASTNLCYGYVPKFKLQLDYLRYFITKKRSRPYFAFSFLVEISHEYQEQVGGSDSEFVEVLKSLRDQIISGETILIFMSDHGHRFDAIRATPQGHLEERLPFVAIASGNEMHRKTLEENSDMLTSHYDLFEVLRGELPEESRPKRSQFGINLLKELVASNRTCLEAGVSEEYCTCSSASDSSTFTKEQIYTYANKAVLFINTLLSQDISRKQCAFLKLHKVTSTFHIGADSVISFETVPGGAMFEVRFASLSQQIKESMLSRINRYGEPCIPHKVLRKYCYCGH